MIKYKKSVGLKAIIPSDFSPPNKSIVVFCSNPTDSAQASFKYMMLCDKLLNGRKDIDIYTVSYLAGEPIKTSGFNNNYSYQKFADTIFLKQVFDKQKNVLSVNEICKKFDNIAFFGHSAGEFVFDKSILCFQKSLKNLGFSSAEIRAILNHIFFVGYSTYSPVQTPVKSVCIAPLFDSLGSSVKSLFDLYERKNVKFSDGSFDLNKFLDFYNTNPYEAMQKFNEIISKSGCLIASNNNSLVLIPGKLNSLGGEDHGLIGIASALTPNASSTQNGRNVAEFLIKMLQNSFSAENEPASKAKGFRQIAKYYQMAIDIFEKNKTNQKEMV